jgi:hypothetical protein
LNLVTARLIAPRCSAKKKKRDLILQLLQAQRATRYTIEHFHYDYLVSANVQQLHLLFKLHQISFALPPTSSLARTPRQPLAPRRKSRAILKTHLRSNNDGRTIQAGVRLAVEVVLVSLRCCVYPGACRAIIFKRLPRSSLAATEP